MCRIFWEQYECCCIHILEDSICCQNVLYPRAETSLVGPVMRDLLRNILPHEYDSYCVGLEIEGYWVYGDCPCCESSMPSRPCREVQVYQKGEEQRQPFLRTTHNDLAKRFASVLGAWSRSTRANAPATRRALNATILRRNIEAERLIRQRRHAVAGGPDRLNMVVRIVRRILEELGGLRRMAHQAVEEDSGDI